MQPNIIIQSLMNQLQQRNPQGYQTLQNLMQSKNDPQKILKQMMGNITPEQRQSILSQAKQFGAPDNILSQFQNMG